ncbi:MAG TPA: hypothetical protein VFW83_07045 [Bryobacteraceae bacterium]|nr:hypothetical protein [Bryobacteraceae bacterium]
MCRSALVALAGMSLLCAADNENRNGPPETRPNGRGDQVRGESHGSHSGGGGGGSTSNNGIFYHGGPVMLGTVNVYYIWYGNWQPCTGSTPAASTCILTDLANSIGGSPYFLINSTYYQGSPAVYIGGQVHYAGSATDNYSQGTSLNDNAVASIVSSAIASGQMGPADANGVYFVFTSSDVSETSGFCNQYCGWHTYGTLGSLNVKFAFVGDPDKCPTACEEQTLVSPNGNTGADGMASIVAHELSEAVTDPNLNAWYDRRGQENADKCAWKFGSTYDPGNGSQANVQLGSRYFLLQQIWLNANGGLCALHN